MDLDSNWRNKHAYFNCHVEQVNIGRAWKYMQILQLN